MCSSSRPRSSSSSSHDHRPEDDPSGRSGRRLYAVGIGLLATLLIAPQTTEFATKVAVLGALALACAARPAAEVLSDKVSFRWTLGGRLRAGALALAAAAAFAGLVVLVGFPARPGTAAASSPALSPATSPRSRSSRRRTSRPRSTRRRPARSQATS